MEILGRGEEPEYILALLLWVFEQRHGGQVGQVNFVPQLVLLVGFVYRERVRAQYEVDRFPRLRSWSVTLEHREKRAGKGYLGLLGAFLHIAALDDTVELEATILVHGREGIQYDVVSQLADRVAKGFSARWQGQWPRLCLHCYHCAKSERSAIEVAQVVGGWEV